MASAIEETFFDFDLNYLHSTSDNTEIQCKLEKYRKSILNLKKKTISTSSLIKKYYAKRDQLEQTEKNLFESKEECKKVCIDYRNTLETCAKLENDIQLLQNVNKELEEKCFIAENQCTALKSHANQLQQLILEHQSEIESLKLEKKPCKTIVKSDGKKYSEKLFNSLKKENDTLRKHISLFRDILLGKRKLNSQHKALLKKYENFDSYHSESVNKTDGHDDYEFSPPPSPICMEDDTSEANFEEVSEILRIHKSPDIKIGKGSDSSYILKRTENDGSSIDTGRGSSLACSDSEKLIGSPNYFSNDSPLSDVSHNSRPEKRHIDIATSPIFILEPVDVSNSPTCQPSKSAPTEHNNYLEITTDTTVVNSLSECLTTERSITPVKTKTDLKRSIFSPLKGNISEVAAVVNNKNTMSRTGYKILPNNEKACLEINNSNNFCDDNTNDGEIEEILQKMRLNYPMTPMPQTPDLNRASLCRSIAENAQTEHRLDFVYPEVAALKEEIKVLRDCIAENNKGMIDIKNLLQMEILSQRKSVQVATEVNIARDDIDSVAYSNEYDSFNNSERPSSAQTVIIEPEELTVVRSPSPHMQILDTCDSDTLFIYEPENITQTDERLSTEINKTPNLSIEFEDSVPFPVESSSIPDITSNAPDSSNSKVLNKQDISSRKFKRRKLSKLNKLKAKMVPRYKISCNSKPIQKKKCLKPKPLIVKKKRKVLACDNAASLNDKSVYEKAVKVMSEIKANQSIDSSNLTPKVVLIKYNDLSHTNNVLELINNIKPLPTSSLPKNSTAISNKTHLEKKDTEETAIQSSYRKELSSINNSRIPPKKKTTVEKKDTEETTKQSPNMKELSNINNNSIPLDKKTTVEQKDIEETIKQSPNMKKLSNIDNSSIPLNKKTTVEKKDTEETTKQSPNMKELSNINNNSIPLNKKITVEQKDTKETIKQSPNMKELSNINNNSIPLNKKTTEEKKSTEEATKQSAHSDLSSINNSNDTDEKFIRRSSRTGYKDKTNEHESIEINKLSKNNGNYEIDLNKVLINNRRITRSNTTNIIQAGNKETEDDKTVKADLKTYKNTQIIRKNFKRPSQDVDKFESPNKRMLRSSAIITRNSDSDHQIIETEAKRTETHTTDTVMEVVQDNTVNKEILSYNDLDMFSSDNNSVRENLERVDFNNRSPERGAKKDHRNNALCSMLQKYGVTKLSHKTRKISDKTISAIGEKLEQNIGKIIEMSDKEAKAAMDVLVSEIENLDMKEFIYGLMYYLQDPQRKLELFKKVVMPPAPAMSKSEQVLLYIISQLNNYWASEDFLEKILGSIEFVMFAINRTPEFNVIESLSHFYAILCRYYEKKCRLRLFMLDAMYCLQFKSIALIKQCIEVWMHVLPLAHMGIAKSPLVTCVVYLLHFFKCEDKFNRVTEIRNILSRKYFFNITNWNENSILEMFRTAIIEMKGNTLQRKMLRIALLLLAKRQGPQWCQKHIINNLLKPIIEKNSVKENIRVFCISMLGPLLKPYPLEMKVHYEIIMNELLEMLRRPASSSVQEAIITSMLCLGRQNQNHVIHALLCWEPNEISPKLEELLRKYVRSKPIKIWKTLLSKSFYSMSI